MRDFVDTAGKLKSRGGRERRRRKEEGRGGGEGVPERGFRCIKQLCSDYLINYRHREDSILLEDLKGGTDTCCLLNTLHQTRIRAEIVIRSKARLPLLWTLKTEKHAYSRREDSCEL
jgi:hypothetical protein